MNEIGKSRGIEIKPERPVMRKLILALTWILNFPYGTKGKGEK